MSRSRIQDFLHGTWAVTIPLLLFGIFSYQNSGRWPCQDDPLTMWISMGAPSWSEVATRSALFPHLPTYFWGARLFGELLGGLSGIRLSSQLFWIGTILWSFFLLRRLEPRAVSGLLCASVLTFVTPFVSFYSCARPYPALALFTVMALDGLVLIPQGRVNIGCTLVVIGAGLAAHMSSITIPVGTAMVALAGLLLFRRSAPRIAWLILLSAVPLFVPAVFKAFGLADRVFPGTSGTGKTEFWMVGAPVWPQLYFVLGSPILALLIVLGRRKKWLAPSSGPATSDLGIVAVAALALVFPLTSLFLHFQIGLDLFASWYHVQDLLLIAILASLLLGTLSHEGLRTAATGMIPILAIVFMVLNAQARSYLKPLASREAIFRYVLDHSAEDDLVIIVSIWFESRYWESYPPELSRSRLLADAYMVAGFGAVRMYPAPGGRTDKDQMEPLVRLWPRKLKELLRNRRRVWYIDNVSLETFFDRNRSDKKYPLLERLYGVGKEPAALGEKGWAFRHLQKLHYQPLSDSVPAQFRGQLFVLEKTD